MGEGGSIWIERTEEANSVIGEFAEDIAPLDIREEDIGGDVLIAGGGQAMPEIVFVGDPSHYFERLRAGVRTLTCCDCELLTSPEHHLEPDYTVEFLGAGEAPSPERGRVFYCPWSLQYFLRGIPEATFNCITFFRINRLYEQFDEDLIDLVARALKPGGVFIGSGSLKDEEAVRGMIGEKLDVETIRRLPNPSSGYPFRPAHIGFVLRKPVEKKGLP